MKKILAGALGAVLLSSALVATAQTAAQADPYPGTIATTTSVTAPGKVKLRKKAQICASVTASGNVAPTGSVTFLVTKKKFNQTVTLAYNGATVCFKTKKLKKKGRYTATATYNPPSQSVFKPSSGSTTFKVKKKRKK